MAKNSSIAKALKKCCEDNNFEFKTGNCEDSVEMMKDTVMKSSNFSMNVENICAIENYPIGLYKFIDI